MRVHLVRDWVCPSRLAPSVNRAVHREEFVLHGAIARDRTTSFRTLVGSPLGSTVGVVAQGASLGHFGIPSEPTSMLPHEGCLFLSYKALSGHHLNAFRMAQQGTVALGEASIALIRLKRLSTTLSLSRSSLWMRKAGALQPIGVCRGGSESHKRGVEGGAKTRVSGFPGRKRSGHHCEGCTARKAQQRRRADTTRNRV